MKPISQIKIDLGLDDKGQRYFTNACYRRMNKYVPKDTGALRSVVSIKKDSITYQSPYAHAQYVGFTKGPVVNYIEPGTGPYWDKAMLSAEKAQLLDEMADYFEKQFDEGLVQEKDYINLRLINEINLRHPRKFDDLGKPEKYSLICESN